MPTQFLQTGSSMADRLARQYQMQFGAPPDANNPGYADFVKTAMPQMIQADRDALAKSQGRWNTVRNIAYGAAAIPFAAAAVPALIGGGAAAGGATSAGAGAGTGSAGAATAGTLSRLGSIFSSPGLQVGANVGLSLLGLHSQNKANAQARRDALDAQTKEIELAQAQLAEQARNADLDRADAKALNDKIQELEGKKFALQQEQAQFERGILEQDQAAKTNYRTTIQEPAAARLRAILGL